MSKIIEFIKKILKYIWGEDYGRFSPPLPATRPQQFNSKPPLYFPNLLYYDEESEYNQNFNWDRKLFKESKFLELLVIYDNKKIKVREFIELLCKENNLHQEIVLIQLQKEQSLITRKFFTNHAFDWALGFGHTDKEKIIRYKGLVNQLVYGIRRMRKLIDISIEAERLKREIKDTWIAIKNKPFKTLDNYSVIPESHTTAMLYSYTPWCGDKDYGNYKAPFGNYLFFLIYKTFLTE